MDVQVRRRSVALDFGTRIRKANLRVNDNNRYKTTTLLFVYFGTVLQANGKRGACCCCNCVTQQHYALYAADTCRRTLRPFPPFYCAQQYRGGRTEIVLHNSSRQCAGQNLKKEKNVLYIFVDEHVVVTRCFATGRFRPLHRCCCDGGKKKRATPTLRVCCTSVIILYIYVYFATTIRVRFPTKIVHIMAECYNNVVRRPRKQDFVISVNIVIITIEKKKMNAIIIRYESQSLSTCTRIQCYVHHKTVKSHAQLTRTVQYACINRERISFVNVKNGNFKTCITSFFWKLFCDWSRVYGRSQSFILYGEIGEDSNRCEKTREQFWVRSSSSQRRLSFDSFGHRFRIVAPTRRRHRYCYRRTCAVLKNCAKRILRNYTFISHDRHRCVRFKLKCTFQ